MYRMIRADEIIEPDGLSRPRVIGSYLLRAFAPHLPPMRTSADGFHKGDA
jgi:hypothetical protein